MFLPFSSEEEILALIDRTTRRRRTQAEMLLTEMSFHADPALPASGYLGELETLLSWPAGQGDRLIGTTWFCLWLETLGRWHQSRTPPEGLRSILPPPLDLKALESLAARFTLREEDVPDFIRAVIPPSHIFRRPVRPGDAPAPGTGAWETALHTAIASADVKMPGMARIIERAVTHFLILDDVAFRSCSADRYLGLILLSTNDQSLIDIEESVVHELGHQILYRIDRDTALFRGKDDPETLVLPWSGSKRNCYGFFHACYIYLILRDYYLRAVETHPFDQDYCRDRLAFIENGLARAGPILLEREKMLTGPGIALRDLMVARMAALARAEVEIA